MRVNIDNRNIGVNFLANGEARIVVWSPLAKTVDVVIDEKKISLTNNLGYWSVTTHEIAPGTKYKIAVDGGDAFPDPASLAQPDDVHGASMAIDVKKFEWTDAAWKNIPQRDYIIYELHTGTFTPQHNFDGIIGKLDYLIDLGINAIEIMPVAQ